MALEQPQKPLPMGIKKIYSVEDMRKAPVEDLYNVLASCGSPGHYQMAVEELQRRLLQDMASQARNLTESSQSVETVTRNLGGTVATVSTSIKTLVRSSQRLERLTWAIIGLTVALVVFTVVQVVLIVRDQVSPKPVPQSQPAVQQTKPSTPKQSHPNRTSNQYGVGGISSGRANLTESTNASRSVSYSAASISNRMKSPFTSRSAKTCEFAPLIWPT